MYYVVYVSFGFEVEVGGRDGYLQIQEVTI